MGWVAVVLGFIMTFIICVERQSWAPFLLFFLTWITLHFIIDREKKQEKIRQEKLEKEREEKETREYEKKREKEREKEEQERIIQERLVREQRIGTLITNSQHSSKIMSEHINLARNALDAAEQEYQDGVFAPFWDAIERVVTNLAHFNTGVRQIAQNCSEYQTESQQLDSPAPVFDWKKAADTTDAIATADRLQKIVRSAQKNFQFAVIYEQRKTNQILVAGFTGLGQALSEIAYRIDESTAALSVAIADLSFTVSDTSEKAIEAGREDAQAVIKSMQVIRKQTKAEAEVETEARREHERRELEMLDNIQRGEEPSFPNYQGGLR